MVKPLSFKGDKPKKRTKHRTTPYPDPSSLSTSTLTKSNPSPPPPSSNPTDPTDIPADESLSAEDTSWVSADTPSDLAGPVLIVLPTEKPTCLATDANGKVFASDIENLVEGDPGTSEPHDVRQVWVATKVAGTEGVSFKGCYGKYLGFDTYGIPTATSTAISHLESFIAIPSTSISGTFSLQTGGGDKETFVSAKEKSGSSTGVEIRGDTGTVSYETTLRIRMQARFKPRIKASKESKAREKISRKELEALVGRGLEDDEVKRLRRARREGDFHEAVLDVRVRGKHDKFA